MEPIVESKTETNGRLTFTLSGVNVSIANALRRIIISEIPCVVFRTTPHAENKVDIQINTTRMNNELIKQRIGCIPIHIDDIEIPIENYEIIIDKKNSSDVVDFVTTEDITINDIETKKMLSESVVRKMFPPNSITGDYIDISRIRPRLSADIQGEHLKLRAKLDIGTAKENGSYNIVSTCSYGNTVDNSINDEKIASMTREMTESGMAADEIAFKVKDWLLLNAELNSVPFSFDFTIETIGQFTNDDVVFRGTRIMLAKVGKFKESIDSNPDLIVESDTTLENGFDITLIDEDYTLGKALEFVLYNNYYDKSPEQTDKLLSFCGFRKPHPHISESIIRLGFINSVKKQDIIDMMVKSCVILETIFHTISESFDKKM